MSAWADSEMSLKVMPPGPMAIFLWLRDFTTKSVRTTREGKAAGVGAAEAAAGKLDVFPLILGRGGAPGRNSQRRFTMDILYGNWPTQQQFRQRQ